MSKTDLASKATHKSAEPEFQPRGVTPKSLPFAVQSVSLEKPERGAKWRGKMTALNGLGLAEQAAVQSAVRTVGMEIWK